MTLSLHRATLIYLWHIKTVDPTAQGVSVWMAQCQMTALFVTPNTFFAASTNHAGALHSLVHFLVLRA